MKKFFWFVAGIAIGAMAVKQINENPQAREFADEATRKAKAFGAAVSEGFRERETELSGESTK
ncbi:MAG: hypothetical protein RLZ28_54 [Actinomycetota bacterium]|jgi:hypothetical protein